MHMVTHSKVCAQREYRQLPQFQYIKIFDGMDEKKACIRFLIGSVLYLHISYSSQCYKFLSKLFKIYYGPGLL